MHSSLLATKPQIPRTVTPQKLTSLITEKGNSLAPPPTARMNYSDGSDVTRAYDAGFAVSSGKSMPTVRQLKYLNESGYGSSIDQLHMN